MHLTPAEAIIVLLVLPAIATMLFWRLHVMWQHEIARWVLAPFVYLGVTAAGIFIGVTLGWYPDVSASRAQYALKLEDWKNHPDVKEVRAVYEEIQSGIRGKRFNTKTRNYDVESPSCSTYPVKSETLVIDQSNQPRMLKIEQFKSHREIFTVERYYDKAKKLRFVLVEDGADPIRIYMNAEGKVFWAVEQDGDKYTVGDYSAGDWPTEPSNAEKAKEVFDEDGSCPEIVK